MKTSLKAIIDGLDLTAEEKVQALSLLGNEKVVKAIDKDLSSIQSESSRLMDESRAAAAAAKADKEAYFGTVNTWKTEQEKKLTAVQEQARKDRDAAVAFRVKMESLTAAGLIAEEDWKDLSDSDKAAAAAASAAAARTTTSNDPDPRYISQSEAEMYLQWPALIADIQAEHYQLTGKVLTDTSKLVQKAQAEKGKKTLRQVWEEEYKVPEIRTAAADKAQKEHDDTIRREEAQRVRQEMTAAPTSRPITGINSPVLVSAAKAQAAATAAGAGNNRGVERALAAHAAGKYADGVPHASA